MAFEVVETGASKVAVIRIVNPPINAVSTPVRLMIVSALSEIATDGSISAVVLCGRGGLFATGFPLRELDDGIAPPTLSDVCRRIEMFSRPVVAALEGHVAAAGFEIALAAHARISTDGAKLGLPDLRLGLPPSGGATQRLPRLIGASGALDMILNAQPHRASDSICKPLIDRYATGAGLLDEAILFASELAESGHWERTRDRFDGMLDPIAYQRQIRDRLTDVGLRSETLTRRTIEAVEAAQLLPFERGLDFERTCFEELRQSKSSQGLRRSRRSEQISNRLIPEAGPKIARMAVLGPKSQMQRLGARMLFGGVGLTLYDPEPDAANEMKDELWERVRPTLTAKGAAVSAAAEAGLRATSEASDLNAVQVCLVAGGDGPERMVRDLNRIAEHVPDDAVVLCQTERLDLSKQVPARLRGRVFAVVLPDRDFPARLAEISVPDTASGAVLGLAQSALWKIGRVLVRGRAGRPMIVPTLFDTMMAAADGLSRAGVMPSRIEEAMRAHGFPRGPYALLLQADRGGYVARTANRRPDLGLSHRVLMDRIAPIAEGKPNIVLDYTAAEMQEGQMLDLTDADIAGAITAALANAGCRLIADGSAQRPMQIDTAMLHGFGYPRSWGGPMAEADLSGLRVVLDRCRALSSIDPAVWAPHPMLQDFFVNGLAFGDLDNRDPDAKAA